LEGLLFSPFQKSFGLAKMTDTGFDINHISRGFSKDDSFTAMGSFSGESGQGFVIIPNAIVAQIRNHHFASLLSG